MQYVELHCKSNFTFLQGASHPDELVERQENTWKPILDWVEEMFDARLRLTAGVMPIPQERAAIDRLQAPMHAMSDFHLTGFHDMVALSGSYAIALAAAAGQFPVESLWSASRVDENWQIEQWGEDSEAKREAENKKVGFLHATELFSAAGKISLTS